MQDAERARDGAATRGRALPLVALFALCLGASSAMAADPFAGKTINIYVGSGAGGVYDVFGRLVARHISRHIAGQPNVVVQPMPGAGGITASNFIYNVAPKDGTAMGIVSPSIGVIEMTKGARYQTSKYQWIGRIVSTVNVTYTRGPGRATNIEEARDRESTIAVSGAGSALAIFTRVMTETAGLRFKPINGYVDAAAMILAVERGEVDGATTSWNSLKNMRPQWLADKSVNVLLQYAPQSHSQLTHVPNALDLGRTKEDRELLALFMSAADVGLALMAPPETPGERVAILRTAFTAMLGDPEFKKEGAMIEPDMDPLPGDKLQALIAATQVDSPQLLEKVRRIVNTE